MAVPAHSGCTLALQALAGQPTATVPVALFTWGFDYTWRIAGLAPWQLACGGTSAWRRAYRALYERHQPDLLFYEGMGSGPGEPELLSETADAWRVRDGNHGTVFELRKDSLALRNAANDRKGCDAVGRIATRADADRLVPLFTGWGPQYLDGLRALIDHLGNRALVLPHHSPAYICACYAFGFEAAMEAMLLNPGLFRHVCDRHAAGDRLRMQELAQAGAQAVFIADGWASCDIISPAMFREFALPYQRSITEAAHAAGLRLILWNEGDILPILADEATLPVDAFAFEQPRKGVAIRITTVRRAFGPVRCLLGNLDSEQLLLRHHPVEIARAVAHQLAESGPDAPFVLSTGSPIPSDVDPAAVDAMIRAARTGRAQGSTSRSKRIPR